jgi:glycosyltransferase involved in cell wall biosynthesis
MRIGINGLSFLVKQVGPCTYFHNVVKELSLQPSDHTFIVFLPAAARHLFPAAERVRYVFLRVPNLIVRIATEQILLPLLALVHRCDILHSTGNTVPVLLGRRNIVTIHDIYFVHDPLRFAFWKRHYLQVLVKLSARVSRLIITVTRCTKNDIVTYYRADPSLVAITYEGYKKIAADDTSGILAVRQRYGITEPYYLFVGTLEPGKNLRNLISGFKGLSVEMQLVVVGKWWVRYKETFRHVEELGLTKRVIFTGYVPDSDLATLYANAMAFVLPSFHEGFGLPMVEAMSFGCPVCCSNTSCLPEIAGDAALLFNPHDVTQIEDALKRVRDPQVRNALAAKGHERLKRFTWESCARRTIQVYDSIAAKAALPADLLDGGS